MINFRSVSIKGAFNFGRARVLWHAGTLKVFVERGLSLEMDADKPIRRKGHIRVWDIKSPAGDMTLRGKCMTCGGKKWRRITYMANDELWGLT